MASKKSTFLWWLAQRGRLGPAYSTRHHGPAQKNCGRTQAGGNRRTRTPWVRHSRYDPCTNQTDT